MRPGIIIFLFVFFYLFYLNLTGVEENLKLKEERSRLERNLSGEKTANQKLEVESKLLQTDGFIEGMAREKLGLIKPGEAAYKVIIK